MLPASSSSQHGPYKFVAQSCQTSILHHSATSLMHRTSTSRITPHIHRVSQTSSQTRNMAFLFPRVAYVPARCAPARNEFAPLFSLFDDSLNELHRASRQARKTFNPRFDIKEAKDSYSVEAEVPGIDQKDISIEFVDEHTLTIKGRSERHTESGSRPTGAVE